MRNSMGRSGVLRVFAALLFCSIVWSQERETATTVILVRHAEKDTVGSDPPLSPGGRGRALALQRVLENISIDVVFATSYRRTQETAQVVASARGLTPVILAVQFGSVARHAEEL
ncbi:MAG: histidine phosphatase family protein, partial [Bacteroidota bacterium]